MSTHYYQYNVQQMIAAILAMTRPLQPFSEVMSLRKAAKAFTVPRHTLARYLKQLAVTDSDSEETVRPRVMALQYQNRHVHSEYSALLETADELILVQWILSCQTYGRSVCRSAIVEKTGRFIAARRNQPYEPVFSEYFTRLVKRHPQLSWRHPTQLKLEKARSVSDESLSDWYEFLNDIIGKYEPKRICAMDESGINGSSIERQRVLARKGSRVCRTQGIGSLKDHWTVIHVCFADGRSLAPIIMSKLQYSERFLAYKLPDDVLLSFSESGYVSQSSFHTVIKHIISSQYDGEGMMLIVDGASVHYGLETIQLMMDHKIDCIILPPNHTHILQVADVGVFGPFKAAYAAAGEQYTQSLISAEVTCHITKDVVPWLLCKAWSVAMKPENVIAGFAATGTYPLRRLTVDHVNTYKSKSTKKKPVSSNSPIKTVLI